MPPLTATLFGITARCEMSRFTIGSQFRAALNPSQASAAATMQTTQLAHKGIECVAPIVMGQPLTARTNCTKATMAKIIAAKRE
jgi:hypothetical protein